MVDKMSDGPALEEGRIEEITRSGDVHEARRLFAKLVASHGSENDFETKIVDAFLGKLGEEPPSVGTVTALSCLVDRGVSVDRIRSDGRLPRAMEYLETSGKVSAADLDDFRRSFDISVETAVKSLETHSQSEEEEDEESKSDLGLWETIREAVLEEDESVAEGEPPTAGLSSMLYKGYQNFKASVDELAQAVEDDVGDDSSNEEEEEEEESVGVLLRRGLESVKETASGLAQAVDDDDDDSSEELEEEQGSSSWVAGLATSSLDYLKTSVVALASSVDSSAKGKEEDTPKKEEEEDASSLAGALVGGWSLV